MSDDVNKGGNVSGEYTEDENGNLQYSTIPVTVDDEYDFVNPKHYHKTFNGAKIEVADVADIWDLNRWEFASLKHLLRQDKPDGERLLDLDKAIWYLQRERNRLQSILEKELP